MQVGDRPKLHGAEWGQAQIAHFPQNVISGMIFKHHPADSVLEYLVQLGPVPILHGAK